MKILFSLLVLLIIIISVLYFYFYLLKDESDTTETTVDVTTETTVDVRTETTVDVTREKTVGVATETCGSFSCVGNTHAKDNMETIQCVGETCVNSDCCDENPMCPSNFSCVGNTHAKDNMETIQCVGETCVNTDCCDENPMCPSNFSCVGNTHAKDNMETIQCVGETCVNSDCCDENPMCPSNFSCVGKTHAKDNMETIQCVGETCVNSDCCDENPTCADGYLNSSGVLDTWDKKCRSKIIGEADRNTGGEWSNHLGRSYMKGKIPVPGMETSGEIQRCSNSVCTEEECCDYIKCNEVSTEILNNDICSDPRSPADARALELFDLFVPSGKNGDTPYWARAGDSPTDRCCEPDNECWPNGVRPLIECSDFNVVSENKEDTQIYFHDKSVLFPLPTDVRYVGRDDPPEPQDTQRNTWDKGAHEESLGGIQPPGNYRRTCCNAIVIDRGGREPINELAPAADGSPRWSFCPDDEVTGSPTYDCGPMYRNWKVAWFNSLEGEEWRDPPLLF